MATREYQFITGIETSASPDPATPSADADIVNKGYGDDTYAKLSSWYDKQANNAGIKAIASADRSDGQLVYHYGVDCFYRFNSASSASDDGDLVLQPDAGTGRWIKTTSSSSAGGGDTIVQQLDTSVAGITCGEAIANRDACCLILHAGSGSNVYRIFKSDSDFGTKNSFAGFAKSAGTVTAQITTYTISAAYVSGNVIPIVINGRTYGTTYASSSDATLQALATLISQDSDVASANVTVVGGNQTGTDDRVITITSKGGLSLNITGTTVTSGASQPTVTLNTSQSASGDTLDLHQYGPLNGFTGLTSGNSYYLSSTAGSISSSPNGSNDPYVGQALSSTILFVNPNNFAFKFRVGAGTMARFTGFQSTPTNGAVDTSEHFNFSTWSTGTASGTAKAWGAMSEGGMQGYAYQIDGQTTSGSSASLIAKRYNLSSWSTVSNRSTAKNGSGPSVLTDILHLSKGCTGTDHTTNTGVIDSFNGATWTNTLSTYGGNGHSSGSFTLDGIINSLPSRNASGGAQNAVHTWNGSSVSSTTAFPVYTDNTLGCSIIGSYGLGLSHNAADTCTGYKYTGTTWSSDIGVSQFGTNVSPFSGPCVAYDPATNRMYWNGGASGAAVLQATTQYYTGTSVSSGTSASIATSASSSGTI